MSNGRKSLADRAWTWLTRINAAVSLVKLLCVGIATGGVTVIAGWLDASWKVIVPLATMAASFIVPGVVWLLFRPRPNPQAERERRAALTCRLNRVVIRLQQLANDAPYPFSFSREAATVWEENAARFVQDSVKPNKARIFIRLPAQFNVDNVQNSAESLRSLAANFTTEDLAD